MQRVVCRLAVLALVLPAVGALAQSQPPPAAPPSAPAKQGPGENLPTLPGVGQPHVTLEELAARVFRIPKKDAVPVSPGRVRTLGVVKQEFQLVGEDGDFLLVRELPPEDPKSVLHGAWLRQQVHEARGLAREEYMKDKYIVADTPDISPPFTEKLVFERRDDGLPRNGHWQMSFDVADMNGDGRPDLVLAPPRLGASHPFIFLQQPDHTWRLWNDVRWPDKNSASLDYGTVRVADFDRDGNPDIAIACHFSRSYVLYGNGQGDFTRVVELPRVNQSISARSLVVADFNNDGRPDIATEDEIDLDLGTNLQQHTGLVDVFLNLPTGWKAVTEGFPNEIQGDWLSAADFDGDGWTDVLLTTRKEGITDLFMRNVGKGLRFEPVASNSVPYSSFVFTNAAGPLDRFKLPDVVECFEQFTPQAEGQPTQACVIYHFHDADGHPSLTPRHDVLFKRKVAYDNVKAVAVGDIDGDGRNDIALVTYNGNLHIFLQFPDGRFYENDPVISLGETDPFDVHIADLYGDGKGEVIVAGSPKGTAGGGGVWVFQPHLKKVAAAARSGKNVP